MALTPTENDQVLALTIRIREKLTEIQGIVAQKRRTKATYDGYIKNTVSKELKATHRTTRDREMRRLQQQIENRRNEIQNSRAEKKRITDRGRARKGK